jgi:hypothetical protein
VIVADDLIDRLRPYREEAVQMVREGCCGHRLVELVAELVRRELDPRPYSEQVSAGIRAAVGRQPLNRWTATAARDRIEALGPAHYGLRRVPDIEKVRSVVAEMKESRVCKPLSALVLLGVPPSLLVSSYSSSMHSTASTT